MEQLLEFENRKSNRIALGGIVALISDTGIQGDFLVGGNGGGGGLGNW